MQQNYGLYGWFEIPHDSSFNVTANMGYHPNCSYFFHSYIDIIILLIILLFFFYIS